MRPNILDRLRERFNSPSVVRGRARLLEKLLPSPASLTYLVIKTNYNSAIARAEWGEYDEFQKCVSDFKKGVAELKSFYKKAIPEEEMRDYYPYTGAISKEEMEQWLRHCAHMAEGLTTAGQLRNRIDILRAQDSRTTTMRRRRNLLPTYDAENAKRQNELKKELRKLQARRNIRNVPTA